MTLYEINNKMMELIDPETGELLDYDTFLSLEIERNKKLEDTALWVKNLLAEASAIKTEETALKARRQAAEAKAARLKDYLAIALAGEKLKTARCSVGYRRSISLQVNDVKKAADWLVRNGMPDLVAYQDPTIDKNSVKALIKSGATVDGCEILESTSIQIK